MRGIRTSIFAVLSAPSSSNGRYAGSSGLPRLRSQDDRPARRSELAPPGPSSTHRTAHPWKTPHAIAPLQKLIQVSFLIAILALHGATMARTQDSTVRGRPRSGCVGAIASSPGRESRPLWSRPRSLENWRDLPGRSPNTFRSPALDALIDRGHHERSYCPQHIPPKTEQGWRHGHGQENPRVHYQPDIFRRWRLDRGSSATHHRSGGIQPAHQSMINRRFDDRASCPARSRPF